MENKPIPPEVRNVECGLFPAWMIWPLSVLIALDAAVFAAMMIYRGLYGK